MTVLSPESILGALPSLAAVLDGQGQVVLAHPGLQSLSDEERPFRGRPFFDALHHLNGIASAATAFARAVPYDELHDSFPVTYVDARSGVPHRYRLELHTFQQDGELFVLAQMLPVSGADHLEQQVYGLQEQLAEVRRLKHDLGNALMACMGHAGLLVDQPNLPDAVQRRLQSLLEKARDVRDLVRGLGEVASGAKETDSGV